LVATPVTEAYVVLGAAGAANEAVTIERSVAELDSMRGLKTLVDAGTVSVSPVQSSDNVDLMSIPLEQHGQVAAIDVASVALVTATVTFDEPFPTGIVPNVTLTLDKTNGADARGEIWVQDVDNTGFDYYYDVTTLMGASTNELNWKATY
jgi:hypothetical protein